MSKYDNLLSICAILLVALLLYKLFPFNRENFELINNGSFNKCSDISSFINKKGNNKIITMKNPVPESDCVLAQGFKNSHKTFYEVENKVRPSMAYECSCWYFETDDWNGTDNVINIILPNKNGENHLPPCSLKKIETKVVDNNTWTKVSTKFKVPNDSNGKISIYLGYLPSASKGSRYITNLSLTIDIPGIKNFPATNSLTSMLLANSKCSYDPSNSSGGFLMQKTGMILLD